MRPCLRQYLWHLTGRSRNCLRKRLTRGSNFSVATGVFQTLGLDSSMSRPPWCLQGYTCDRVSIFYWYAILQPTVYYPYNLSSVLSNCGLLGFMFQTLRDVVATGSATILLLRLLRSRLRDFTHRWKLHVVATSRLRLSMERWHARAGWRHISAIL